MLRCILDTDPGIDDALALFLALASPEVSLEAITTVSGNVPVELTTRNALALLELAGRTEIPVARGCTYPLLRPAVTASHVHADNGLGNVKLPAPHMKAAPQHAVDLIIETVLNAPGDITLVPIGPLTNIAMAVRREPRLAKLVREVVIMGGAVRVPGNVTPSAEFNIYVDPEAAHIVLQAGWPIRLVSLDATMQVGVARAAFDTLAQQGTRVTSFIQEMMHFYFEVFSPLYGTPYFHMHDPLCMAAAFQPDLITWESAHVAVELAGKHTLGATIGYFATPNHAEHPDDPGQEDALTPNALVSTGVAQDRFLNLFMERIAKL